MAVYKKYFSENRDKKFPIYAYSPPPQGYYWIDDVIYPTDDFRTVERYKEYKECGFNLLFMQRTAAYNGEEWETSETKRAMQNAVEAGIEKIIIVDERIFALSMEKNGLIGENKKFATESELDEFLKDCIKDYKNEKGFYGVQLMDEPFHPLLEAIGEIFKAFKRIDEKIFVHCNLNPLILPTLAFRICPKGKNLHDAYEKYLNMFINKTGADYIMVDCYPYYKSPDKSNIGKYYFACLEIIAKVCKERKVEMHMVMQSFAMNIGKKPYHMMPNKRVFEFQKNVLLGFGVKEFSYFTYWTKQANKKSGEMFIDGKAMMTRHGEKTKGYYNVQKLNAEITKLAPLLCDFEYQANAFFSTPPLFTKPTFLDLVKGGELSQVEDVEVDKETLLISELFDKKRGQYMYYATNVADPKHYCKKYKTEKQFTQVTFNEKYTVADLYFKGKWQTIKLEKGKLKIELHSGDGIIILPYKED
ncbi:MAG: hypothetical protein IKJ19_06015 [Clostridia bacterium]|nr:hypothetical protein [Clostridia bacterium]